MALNQVECRRCGWKWVVSPDKKDNKDLLCKSCRVKPAKVIQYGSLRCEPHLGVVNDNLDPVDESGALVLPGLRTCGHRDCVNPKHVAS